LTADDLATGLLIITSGNSDRGRVQLFHSEHLNSRDYCTYHIQMHLALCCLVSNLSLWQIKRSFRNMEWKHNATMSRWRMTTQSYVQMKN